MDSIHSFCYIKKVAQPHADQTAMPAIMNDPVCHCNEKDRSNFYLLFPGPPQIFLLRIQQHTDVSFTVKTAS